MYHSLDRMFDLPVIPIEGHSGICVAQHTSPSSDAQCIAKKWAAEEPVIWFLVGMEQIWLQDKSKPVAPSSILIGHYPWIGGDL